MQARLYFYEDGWTDKSGEQGTDTKVMSFWSDGAFNRHSIVASASWYDGAFKVMQSHYIDGQKSIIFRNTLPGFYYSNNA